MYFTHAPGVAEADVFAAQEAGFALVTVNDRLLAETVVGSDDHAAFPGRDHLRRVEGESTGDAKGSGRSSAEGAAVCMGGVLHEEQTATIAQLADRNDVGGDDAADVHDDHASRLRGERRLDGFGGEREA